MLNKPIDKLIFFDIETTSQYATFTEMPERKRTLFMKRFKKEFGEAETLAKQNTDANLPTEVLLDKMYEEIYSTKAPLFPETGRILCISCGLLTEKDGNYMLKVVSYANADEKKLLADFLKGMEKPFSSPLSNPIYAFVGHNCLIFDVPYIAKRLIINQMGLPAYFDIAESKPWELKQFIDTKNVWKFGVFDHNVSLDALCDIFDISSSKDDMDGSQVKDEFWKKQNMAGITKYCEKDVKALAQCYLKMKNINKQISNV